MRGNIISPARLDYVQANDTCIQCHSQGRPLTNPVEGKYYDWAVGYRVGLHLSDYWQLEDHTLGQTTFTHYADGTARLRRFAIGPNGRRGDSSKDGRCRKHMEVLRAVA